ncbi:SDR family NAD(P)-dependent oxidoreductase [Alteromonadaceae bacterium BrNp21-10]|nr:SDR family NAD(P)-dependent oxidoreductase [Alteromonadaceae bacterium BrNp21-10]
MKNVLITGATSGIGKALVGEYCKAGFSVYACGRDKKKLNELTQQFGNVSILQFDVCDRQQVLAIAEQINDLDHLILNAGNCEYMDNARQFDSELFERVIHVNLISVGYCLDALLKKVVQGGQVGLVSSSVTYLPFSRAQAYGASKSALNYLAHSLSIDLASEKIGVSLIQPGFVKTPLTDKNTFSMPAQVSAEYAAEKIFKGMQKAKLHIRFPAFFIFSLQALACLPFILWQKLAILMVSK